MAKTAALIYGVAAYAFFFVTFCYAIGFVENLGVPKAIDDGSVGLVAPSAAVNLLLLGLFGLQHSIMARPKFKDWWCRFIPRPVERSTFVLLATVILAILMWQWRPMPQTVWHIQSPVLKNLLYGISFGGWLLVLYATFVIDHFDLFGLRQVWLYFRGIEYHHPPFMERSIYRYVRHPLMAGFIVAFWSAPTMTQGRLLFAVVTTVYILAAIQIEERDLVSMLGDPYREYRSRTPMLIPIPSGRARQGADS